MLNRKALGQAPVCLRGGSIMGMPDCWAKTYLHSFCQSCGACGVRGSADSSNGFFDFT